MSLCYSPISIQNPASSDKNNRITVPCGKCYNCRTNHRNAWTFRLYSELKDHDNAYFLTLTYAKGMIKQGGLHKSDLQTYIKRVRYYTNFRYYGIGEYGETTFRPHYHLLAFGFSNESKQKFIDCWEHGNVYIGTVTSQSIHYVTKDLNKFLGKENGRNKEFRIMSTKPAIGFNEIKNMWRNVKQKDFTVNYNGLPMTMPRIYQEKIFSYKDREKHGKDMQVLSDELEQRYIKSRTRKGVKHIESFKIKERKSLELQEIKKLKQRKL